MNYLLRLLRDERFIKVVLQIVFVAVVIVSLVTLWQNIVQALSAKNLAPTMAFWGSRAGFGLGGAEAYYSPDDSYARALMVGLENTIRVVIVGLPLTTLVGIFFGVCLLSSNFLVKNIARVYVEILRNTPLLVQLFAFYFIVVLALPPIREAIEFPAGGPLVSLSNKGFVLPEFHATPRFMIFGVIAAVGFAMAYVIQRELRQISERTGRENRRLLIALGIVAAALVIGYAVAAIPPAPETVTVERSGELVEIPVSEAEASGLLSTAERIETTRSPLVMVSPQRQGLRYAAGSVYSPEYIALLLGLVIYTSAFIAEIVRAGIQAVDKGQVEASRALGFGQTKTLTLIILPQALRVIIPPMGNQYLNLAKNSSLAIAISFTDLFQVSNTIINQTGQTVSVFAIVILIYLVMSLIISYFMNTINSRFQLVSRTSSAYRAPLTRFADMFRRAPARR